MFHSKTIRCKLLTLPLVALLSGCVYPGTHQSCQNCGPQHGPGTPVETFPPAIDDTLARNYADAKSRAQELAMQLTDAKAERDRLQDQVTRMERERSATLHSVTTANHQVEATRSELDRASQDIRLMRQQLQQVIDEVSNLDAAHAAQMGQFSRRLDVLVHEYADDSGVKGSYPLGPSMPQKP